MFSGDEPFPPGSEPGELGELRGRLLFLLETSKHYQAQHLLTHFPESRLTISLIIVTSLITESGIRPGVVVKFSLSKCCLSWLMCIKGFFYPLSHDCHSGSDRDVSITYRWFSGLRGCLRSDNTAADRCHSGPLREHFSSPDNANNALGRRNPPIMSKPSS